MNPAKTLLAVSLPSSLLLVILPRPTSISAPNSSHIPVKAHKIGTFYHNSHTPKAEHIVSTQWHPWSKRSTSLLVLLRNGTFFEYDVARDTSEPQQTLNLLPRSARVASPRFGLGSRSRSIRFGQSSSNNGLDDDDDDDDEEEEASAVSFTLGIGDDTDYAPDWLPLTIYILTKSGDVHAAAPFLPRFARVPASYLHALSTAVQHSPPTNGGKQREYSLRFVSNLLKQAKAYQDEQADQAANESMGLGRRDRSATPADVIGRTGRRARSAVSMMSIDPPEDDEGDRDGAADDSGVAEFVEIKAPTAPLVPGPVVSQGPFLLAPAPHELSETREGQGSDISHIRIPAKTPDATSLDLLVIANDDGRVDIAVLDISGRIVPQWSSSQATNTSRIARDFGKSLRQSHRTSRNQRAGRYGLDDSSDEDEDEDDEDDDDIDAFDNGHRSELPTLFLYETLDLGFNKDAVSLRPLPRIVRDPVYPDTLYVQHAFGAHMISLSTWTDELAELIASAQVDEELMRFLHASVGSEAKWVVRIQDAPEQTSEESGREGVSAVQVVDDIYLGYSLLILLGDGECFGVEMGMRAAGLTARADADDEQPSDNAADGQASARKYYTSLLGSEPFVAPAPFNDSAAAFPSTRLKTTSTKGTKEIEVTPDSLRMLGTTVQDLRGKMREVVNGGNAIQRRLELQMKELERQLGKLADVRDRIEGHQQKGSLKDRINRASARQRGLVVRVDRILQRSMDAAATASTSSSASSISKYEEAWLKEMAHIESEIGSAASGSGLEAHVQKLRGQLEELKPDLHLVAADVESKRTRGQALGSKQLDKVLSVLGQEAERLVEAKDKVHTLNRSIARASGVNASRA